jgi:periplasmic protein TonB
MKPNDVLHADLLDILFENRNKSYGAYPLRKFYAQRLLISMGVTVSLVIVGVFFYLNGQTLPVKIFAPEVPDPTFTQVDLRPDVKPVIPTARPAAPKPPATMIFTTPVIVANIDEPKPLATVEDLNKTAIGLTTTAGGPDNGQSSGNGNGNLTSGTTASTDSTEGTEVIMERAELMPEFPGGTDALKRFLIKNLRMPDNNLESGTQIRVVARFVVGADGKVREVEIAQAAEDAYNIEVKRVISKMPDWKPGMQNHRKVAVYFNLPVIFVSND